jgi:hypothetical protein
MAAEITDADARALLHLPEGFVAPETAMLIQDARAILLHTLALRRDLASSEIVISPIWENHDGQAALRAAIVPPEVANQFFGGSSLASLKEESVLEMIADIVAMFADDLVGAARVLQSTEELWISKEAPIRPLGMPWKNHFKLLTLTIADFSRKISAGMNELEWITSIGLLDAFHDPSTDPPIAEVRASTAEKSARLHANEEKWMAEFLAAAQR